jgi:hypothetical protein
MLSETEKAHFEKWGWVGPFPLLTPAEVGDLSQVYANSADQFLTGQDLPAIASNDPLPKFWAKSLHAHIPEFRRLIQHPDLVERVASVLGPNVIAWGVSVTTRQPGQVHGWHVDVEHRRWRGITAFIGLTGTSPKSTLQLIPGSHRFDVMPQTLEAYDDAAALAAARKISADSEIVSVPVHEGEFFLFDGPLWHGSTNVGNVTRLAVIAQFAPPSDRIAIQMTCDEPVRWHSSKPPCVLVKGQDALGLNHLV